MENTALQSLQIFSLCYARFYARKLLPLSALKVVAISVRNTIVRKFANFVRLYFPHITTFFNQILGFYYFLKVLFGNVIFVVGICLEQKLVYKENCLLVMHVSGEEKARKYERRLRYKRSPLSFMVPRALACLAC